MTAQQIRVQNTPVPLGTRSPIASSRSNRSLVSKSGCLQKLESEEFETLNRIFQKTAFSGPSEGLVSDAMKGAYDHTANTGGLYRSIVDLWGSFEDNPPIHDDFLRPMLGMTTAGYFPIAVLGIRKSFEKLQLAERLGDKEGLLLAELELYQRMTTAFGGALFTAARPLCIAACVSGVSVSGFTAPTALGRATYTLGTLGGWFFGGTSLIAGIRSSIGLHEVRMFDQKLSACKSVSEKMAFLHSCTHTDAREVYQILREKYEKQFSGYKDKAARVSRAIKDELVHEAILKGAEEMHAMLKELSQEPGSTIKEMSIKECEKLISQMMRNQMKIFPQSEAEQILRNTLCIQGMAVMVGKLQMKKDSDMCRILTPECVQMIKEKQDPSLVLEKVNKAIYSSYKTHVLNLFLAILGVATTIGGIFITGGGLLIVLGLLSVVGNLSGFWVDARGFVKELKSGLPGRHDKVFLVINMAVSITCFLIGLGLMIAFGQFALFPFLFGLLILATWMGAHAYAWKRINENEKKRKAEHPTLHYFIENMKQEKDKEKIRALFSKLTKEDRRGIDLQLLERNPEKAAFTHQDVQDAANAHLLDMQQREKAKKQQMVQALQPILHKYLPAS